MSLPIDKPRRVRVQIDRGGWETSYETFHGLVLREATTHFYVQWPNHDGESFSTGWFAKASRRVSCTELDEDLNPLVPPL